MKRVVIIKGNFNVKPGREVHASIDRLLSEGFPSRLLRTTARIAEVIKNELYSIRRPF